MPVCPKCRAEYQEGYTVCTDCKVELVEDIKEAIELVPFFQAEEKKIAEKLLKFFEYSDLEASLNYDEENEIYIISIPPRMQNEAKKLYQAFYFVERERMEKGESDLLADEDSEKENPGKEESEDTADEDSVREDADEEDSDEEDGDEDTEEVSEDDETAESSTPDADEDTEHNVNKENTPSDEVNAFDDEEEPSTAYIMKADQYKDLTGTVWIFLFFGLAGLVVVLLNVLGILSFFNGWIPNTVMGILFLFFIYIALSTNQKAKKVQTEIDAENKLTEKINEWLKANVTEDFLASVSNENVSRELNYIKQTDAIKELLLKEFGSQNLAYLDRLIEEYYNRTFDDISE